MFRLTLFKQARSEMSSSLLRNKKCVPLQSVASLCTQQVLQRGLNSASPTQCLWRPCISPFSHSSSCIFVWIFSRPSASDSMMQSKAFFVIIHKMFWIQPLRKSVKIVLRMNTDCAFSSCMVLILSWSFLTSSWTRCNRKWPGAFSCWTQARQASLSATMATQGSIFFSYLAS